MQRLRFSQRELTISIWCSSRGRGRGRHASNVWGLLKVSRSKGPWSLKDHLAFSFAVTMSFVEKLGQMKAKRMQRLRFSQWEHCVVFVCGPKELEWQFSPPEFTKLSMAAVYLWQIEFTQAKNTKTSTSRKVIINAFLSIILRHIYRKITISTNFNKFKITFKCNN
jgi:hypothetical protein